MIILRRTITITASIVFDIKQLITVAAERSTDLKPASDLGLVDVGAPRIDGRLQLGQPVLLLRHRQRHRRRQRRRRHWERALDLLVGEGSLGRRG